MAHKNQIDFLIENKDSIHEPILLVGSRLYDFDKFDMEEELNKLGFNDIVGIDIESGPGVHYVIDITQIENEFHNKYRSYFKTVVCLDVLSNVKNPFMAADSISKLSNEGAILLVSECFVRKLSRMPVDYWRFSYDGFKALFLDFTFYDDQARFSITRQRDGSLKKLERNFEELLAGQKHNQESLIGFYIRRLHRKYLSKGVFKISRWLPEQTVYAVGRKNT